jgi:hypothetical protein
VAEGKHELNQHSRLPWAVLEGIVGIRAVSRSHASDPYVLEMDGQEYPTGPGATR